MLVHGAPTRRRHRAAGRTSCTSRPCRRSSSTPPSSTAAASQRAIGVVYRPETELFSHYFDATVGEQFDAVIHLDETHAVAPLERTSEWERGELPDTCPWGV